MATTLSHPVIPCNHARSTFRSRPVAETPSCPVFSCSQVINVIEYVLLDIYQVIDSMVQSYLSLMCIPKNVVTEIANVNLLQDEKKISL